MKKKDIKVGERYAVVKRMGNDATIDKSVAATIMETGVEYETLRWGTFRSTNVTMSDGIRVRFDEPVVVRHYHFETLRSIEERATLRDDVIEKLREEAVTEYILPGSKHVLRPQAEVDEMRARWAEENRERGIKVGEIGNAVEPVYAAVTDRLKDIEHGVRQYTAKDEHGTKRITDATFTFDLDAMAALLGVSVEA